MPSSNPILFNPATAGLVLICEDVCTCLQRSPNIIWRFIMSNNLFVGADIDAKKFVICFLDDKGEQLGKMFSLPNSLLGTQSLTEKIIALCKKHNLNEIKIGCEATSQYSFHFLNEMSSDKNLLELNTQVFQFNPKLIRGFKKC